MSLVLPARLLVTLSLLVGAVSVMSMRAPAAHADYFCWEMGAYSSNPCKNPQPQNWDTGDAVGSCGITTPGAYIRSLQFILVIGGDMSSADIDGYWGPGTKAALEEWQSHQGLSADGCAGYYTLQKEQHGSDQVRSVDNVVDTVAHFVYLGQVAGPANTTVGKWRYQQPKYTSGVRYYYWDSSPGSWWFFNGYTPDSDTGYCVHEGAEVCAVI